LGEGCSTACALGGENRIELVAVHTHRRAVGFRNAELLGIHLIKITCDCGDVSRDEIIGEAGDGIGQLLDCFHDNRDYGAVIDTGDGASLVVGCQVKIHSRGVFGDEAVTYGAGGVVVVDEGDGLEGDDFCKCIEVEVLDGVLGGAQGGSAAV
jgi:hypothetical protein